MSAVVVEQVKQLIEDLSVAEVVGLTETLQVLSGFAISYLTQADQVWAMDHLRTYRLSHGVEINDCLIASVCHRLQIPLYTHNIKDMTRILDSSLVIKPD